MKGGHTKDLQQRILRFATLGILVATGVVALVTLPPLYLTSREYSETILLKSLEGEAGAIREVVGKYRDVAEQIASRTHARRLLAAHARGEITLDTLRRFTRPIIEDALAHAPEIQAFLRRAAGGEVVVRMGEFPREVGGDLGLGGRPRMILYTLSHGGAALGVHTPVQDRNHGPVGYDLALFRLAALTRLLQSHDEHGPGRLYLAWEDAGGWRALDGDGTRPLPDALAPLSSGPGGQLRQVETPEGGRLVSMAPIAGTPFTLVLEADPALVYAQARRQLLLTALALLSFALLTLWGTRRLIRPLAGKVVIRNDELNQRIARQTAELRRTNRILRLHSAAVDTLVHGADEATLLGDLCRVLVEQGGYAFAWMAYGDGNAPLRLAAHHGAPDHGLILLDGSPGEDAARQALIEGQARVEQRLDPQSLCDRWHLGGANAGVRAAVALPLIHGETVFGVLAVFSNESEAFTGADERAVLTELAEDLAYAIATLRLQRERAHTEQERRKLSSAIEQTANIVMITDRDGVVEYVNPEFERVTGYRREEIVGRTPAVLTSGRHDRAFYERMWDTLLTGEVFRETFVNQRKNGDLYYEDKTITPIRDEDGRITHFVSTGRDITDSIKTQERVYYLAYHDVLTGLPNRTLFRDRLEHAVRKAGRSGEQVALMFIDLDRFKHVNDSLGHQAGDELLCQVAERIAQCVRQGDTVARLGGDEFTVIAEGLEDPEKAAVVAENLIQAITAPVTLRGQQVYVSASIGIALYPSDSDNVDGLLRAADTAMYRAKEEGRNNYQFHTADMTAKAFERVLMESALRHALERDEFHLCYQPRIDLASGELVCLEALLRWRHPQKGLIMPAQFIPVLEETGLIVPITEWLIGRVCDQIGAWEKDGMAPCRVSINLSAVHFRSQRLLRFAHDLLGSRGVDPALLELEITESMLMEDMEASVEVLAALRDMGLRITVDDFGTGFSSLAYLKRLPLSCLKIDRSFVRDLPEDSDDRAIVEAIVSLAHTLSLKVTAEGVENSAQLRLLRELDCDEVQGTLFSPPLEADAVPAWLRARETAGEVPVKLVEPAQGA